jgi:hypothetical protein
MRKAFSGLTALVMLIVVVQFYLAASGAFNTAPKDESFAPHRTLGYLILLLTIIMTLVAALARMPGRIIGLSGLIVGLTVLQPVIAAIAEAFGDSGSSTTAGTIVFGLHAVNALIIFTMLRRLLLQSRELTATLPTGAVSRAGQGEGGL